MIILYMINSKCTYSKYFNGCKYNYFSLFMIIFMLNIRIAIIKLHSLMAVSNWNNKMSYFKFKTIFR
jgi:hypothetical protein